MFKTKALISVLIGLISIWSTGYAMADDSRAVRVAAGDLDVALESLGKQYGVDVIYESRQIRGLKTRGVSGTFEVEDAFKTVLKDTPLVARKDSSGVILITAANGSADSPAGRRGDSTGQDTTKEVGKKSSQDFRVAQMDQRSPQTGSAASADSLDPPRRGTVVEEVIVTAQRRAENIREVPMSISAVTSGDIERRGLFNAADVLSGIPSVNQIDGGPFASAIVIRGIETSTTSQNFNSGTTTATYFGETPTTNSAGMAGNSNVDIKLVDIERIEVLRGPQGTAFGSSSLGGAVRTIPVAPKLDRFEGRVTAGYSETSGTGADNYTFQGVLNAPIVQNMLAVRAVAYKYQDSGFYRNRAGSDPQFQANVVARYQVPGNFAIDQNNVGAYSVTGGRIAALFQPLEDLKVGINYLRQQSQTNGVAMANSGTFTQSFLQLAQPQVRRGQTGGVYDTYLTLANATVEYALGWANVLGTYSHIDSHSVGAFPFAYVGQANAATDDADSKHGENVEELRLVSALHGPVSFLVGLYHEQLEDGPENEFLQTYYWVGSPATNIYAPGGASLVGTNYDRRTSKQSAAYGEVSWKILEELTLTGGLRHYSYDRKRHYVTAGPFIGNTDSTMRANASGTTKRASLSYKGGENWLLYTGYSEGFRLGRPQVALPTICDRDGDGVIDGTSTPIASTGALNSDRVKNYELGGKASFLDHRLSLDGAIFSMDWSGFPVQMLPPGPPTGCGLNYTISAGRARSDGIELQLNIRATRALRLDLGGAWYNPRLTEDVPAAGLHKGYRLAGAPKVNANFGAEYAFAIFGREASLRADSTYVGTFYGNILQSPLTKAGGYTKLDTSLRVSFGSVDVDLFVHNLTNDDAFVFRRLGANTVFFGNRLRPRTVGINLSATL